MLNSNSNSKSCGVKRKESFLSRSFHSLVRRESLFNPKTKPIVENRNSCSYKSSLGRALSFKYPEKVSYLPPPELTRLISQRSSYYDSDSEEPPLPRSIPMGYYGAWLSSQRPHSPNPFSNILYHERKKDKEQQNDSFFDETLVPIAMVSRKKILSRSRDDLHLDDGYTLEDEEDVWYQKDKIYKDHIAEVLEKWESIDDEIWAKVIVLERNRRVAKAYARAPVLTVNGSNDGFDGFRIGVNGFDNPMRDPKTEEFKNQIGQGCKIKMDETGNILIKRFGKSPIFVKNTNEENAICNDILKLPHGLLEFEKPFKLFDMKKFQQNVNREMKRNFPDRRRLEVQTISTIALVKNEEELLDSPIWIMLINIVALEMLRAKIPSTSSPTMPLQNNSCEATKRFTASGSSDEDPYSLTPSGSSGSSGKGGNYPTTDKEYYGPQNWSKSRRNQSVDLSDEMEEPKENRPHRKNEKLNNGQRLKSRFPESSGEDPYYCGMKARVPNFGAKKKEGKKLLLNEITKMKALSSNARSTPNLQNIAGVQPYWWNSRLYSDSGLGDIPSYHYPGGGPRGIRNSLSTFRASPHMIGLHTSKSTTAMYHQGWE